MENRHEFLVQDSRIIQLGSGDTLLFGLEDIGDIGPSEWGILIKFFENIGVKVIIVHAKVHMAKISEDTYLKLVELFSQGLTPPDTMFIIEKEK